MEESGANNYPPEVAQLSAGNFSATNISANLILLKRRVVNVISEAKSLKN
ncbi:hypothetical protein OQ279_03975 [Salinimicrobium sp. MT39]|uniref:Uncharacterized protein n=1 Tax=Salinimicrobium profundisediminis TaxID=2994553 RepID=A0A9X3CV88_9FLAO|nr:hypothetical protein [Salinimicrobium profundisediminis]MCX2837299.1 hypothetical protein [Salinimicrobium profundisediminis]